jgi:hypothetical protein
MPSKRNMLSRNERGSSSDSSTSQFEGFSRKKYRKSSPKKSLPCDDSFVSINFRINYS